jgi:2-polyprenyl-3-methyl-5-hydroxy-6-metoxy-1,4-benzoquinol methylase
MIHVNRKSYPYMEEVNEGALREFRRLAPATGRVLDVGCGRAALGGAIRGLGWEVWGVEQSGEACATADKRLHRLVQADLHDLPRVRAAVGETRFEALVFSDVLQHVYDPRTVLENYLEFVKPGGRVLISVPNMLVWTNRLQLLLGRFEYTDTGVMDRTHIRFFTFRTVRRLAEAAGCRVERVASTPYLMRAVLPLLKRVLPHGRESGPDPRALIDSRGYQLYMKCVYPVEHARAALWRTLFAFRIIVVGVKPASEEVPGRGR